jgi:hypothetical protein
MTLLGGDTVLYDSSIHGNSTSAADEPKAAADEPKAVDAGSGAETGEEGEKEEEKEKKEGSVDTVDTIDTIDTVGCVRVLLDEDPLVPPGLELAVRAMKKGEKARVIIQVL